MCYKAEKCIINHLHLYAFSFLTIMCVGVGVIFWEHSANYENLINIQHIALFVMIGLVCKLIKHFISYDSDMMFML